MGQRETLLYKGDSVSLKFLVIAVSCGIIIGVGYGKVLKHRADTQLLDEAVRLIGFIRTELKYRRSDCENLFYNARGNGFSCISFVDGRIVPDDRFSEKARKELEIFLSSIGTTDAEGQIALCDEYHERLKQLYGEQQELEKSKIQVDFAVCILGAFSVIVLFL